ncbi:hypothetical protein Dsin_000890 [Dipteronia sinensis]|uniref:Reverse transcriptase zinc-binding domain-containing protein n=1 Tax=Dipteronia sinensis TaxID=43782 RepID=A0AAE0B4I6_9ROSI|nr:hypothetical protein Dsin_000890 [Dipteronia sinensis]
MDEWKKKRVTGSKGLGLAVKLKAVKSVLKNWQRVVRLEDYSLDKLESRLEVIEAMAKMSGWNSNLRDERRKVLHLVWDWDGGHLTSNFITSVGGLLKTNLMADEIIAELLGVVVGNGMRASFWRDLKVAGIPLADACPRIHALAAKKIRAINEFGAWNDIVWQWNIVTRRPLLGWEEEFWFNFINEVEKFKLRRSMPDFLIWTLTSYGQLSVSSFRREIEARMANDTHRLENALLWSGVVPPNVYLFLWMVIKRRLLVGALLPKFTGGKVGSQLSLFCNKVVESIDHLFIGCAWSWSLWSMCLDWWDISACVPDNVKDWMEEWMYLCYDARSG